MQSSINQDTAKLYDILLTIKDECVKIISNEKQITKEQIIEKLTELAEKVDLVVFNMGDKDV
jgi:hypothetical protein